MSGDTGKSPHLTLIIASSPCSEPQTLSTDWKEFNFYIILREQRTFAVSKMKNLEPLRKNVSETE